VTTKNHPAIEPGVGASSASGGGRFDLLRLPGVGRFLHWPWSRTVLQIPVLAISVIMVVEGLCGSQLAPKNLATLLTWVHFRGLVVLALLFGGNFFCMACPFMLPRDLARRWASPRWNWPRWLRNKWPAAILFAAVLFTYEWLNLWSDPYATAILIVVYFAGAFVIDFAFRRASFCKFVCPVGQFNFLGSTLSPLEVTVRQTDVCGTCHTKDCITGRRASGGKRRVVQRGCELDLFQPRKVGNLDCTFCMDCVYACPHDNIGILARVPGEELTASRSKSSIGSPDRRSDWTILIVVFVFGAVLNAFAMVSPVYALEQIIAQATGIGGKWPVLGCLFGLFLVLEPAVLLVGAALLTRRGAGIGIGVGRIINRFSWSLVPVGFGVWLAHYGLHFLTGAFTIIPVTQYAARMAAGWDLLGAPLWQLGGLPQSIVFPIDLGFLALGLLGSWLVGWRIAAELAPSRKVQAFAPWAAVCLLLLATAWWTMSQPMDMRVTFVGK
jgi:polyferredoxin